MTLAIPKLPSVQSASRVLWLLVFLGLVAYLAFTLWLGIAGLVYPYQLDYGEGIVLWFARELANGHSIYKGLTGYPYASSNYPPVAMLLAAILMPVFGTGYVAGRLLNFASALIVTALIYRIVRRETQAYQFSGAAAALAALVFIGSPYIYGWVPLFRTDLLGLAFAFGGLFCVWQWERQTARHRVTLLIAAGALFLLALYTKQTLFAAPAAAFLALWPRDRRIAIAFAGMLAAVGGTLYLLLDYVTQGAFTFGMITSNATVFLAEQLLQLLENFALTFAVLIALALVSLVRRIRARRSGVLEWYAIIAVAALAMAGRVGAWENYFFEALAILCVFAGITMARWMDRRELSLLALPLVLLAQIALMWHDPRIAGDLMAADAPANRELAALLARTPGPVISEDMGALVTSGKDVAYYTYQYSMLARSGKWDQSWELDGLRDRLFPLVILERGTREDVEHYRRFTRAFVSTLDRYYAQVASIGKYAVYAPAPPLHESLTDANDTIRVVGWSANEEALRPGKLELTIVWTARRSVGRPYTAFVHLEAEDAPFLKIAQDDHEPRGGLYPTTRWATGETVRELYSLAVPDHLPPGRYVLRVGWYDAETGDRLPVPESADDSIVLTRYEVSK